MTCGVPVLTNTDPRAPSGDGHRAIGSTKDIHLPETGDRFALPRLLVELGAAGVELTCHPDDAGRLRHRPATLVPELAARTRLHKGALLAQLNRGLPSAAGTDAAVVYAERLGVADDLGMTTHVGSPGWLIAVGEALAFGGTEQTSSK